MSFPPGPFFNFRTYEDFGFVKRTIWRVFGEKVSHTHKGYYVEAYYFRGITYIHKCEPLKDIIME